MAAAEPQRVALVTGGARRVGRAVVERLAAAGFAVAFTYLGSEEDARTLAQSPNITALRADLTQSQEVVKLADAVLTRFGRLDVLMNNASIYQPAPENPTSSDQELVQLRRMMAIHLEAPLLLCRHLGDALRRSRGHVVNMVDLLVERPLPKYLGYSTTKAALANLTLGLARELAPEVTVNGIAPGVVEWPADYPAELRQKYLQRVPLNRPGTPSDVAELVHFLVTSGSYITGQILRLDGGRSIT